MPTIRDISSGWSSAVSHVVIWLLAAVLLGGDWWQAVSQIETDRQRVIRVAEHDLVNLGRANQEHAVRTFDSVDQVLRLIQTQYTGHRGHVTLDTLGAQGALDQNILRDVSIIDAWGVLRQSTRGSFDVLDLSSRDYFKAHIGSGADSLFISRPVREKGAGEWSIYVSRRVTDRDGAFAGVVVAVLDPRYFTRFYRQIDLGPGGVVSLFGLDGAMRARSKGSSEDFVTSVANSPMFASLARGEQTATITFGSLVDGIERTFHFRKLPAYPMISAVGMTTEHILAPHLETQIPSPGRSCPRPLSSFLHWRRPHPPTRSPSGVVLPRSARPSCGCRPLPIVYQAWSTSTSSAPMAAPAFRLPAPVYVISCGFKRIKWSTTPPHFLR